MGRDGATGTLSINGGTAQITTGDNFSVTQIIAGDNVVGAITQDGGSIASNSWIVIGKAAAGRGTYSKKPQPERQVTLIEIETLEAIQRDHKLDLLGERREFRDLRARLTREINYWDTRAARLREEERAGKEQRINASNAEATAQRGEAQRMAHHDGLTGLPNRRLFDENLPRELARCARSGPSPGTPPIRSPRAVRKMAAMARTPTGSSTITSTRSS